jgi:hypothetical protein
MASNSTPPSFIIEHPWMTFFLALASLKTIETVIRGYGPDRPLLSFTSAPCERGVYGSNSPR